MMGDQQVARTRESISETGCFIYVGKIPVACAVGTNH